MDIIIVAGATLALALSTSVFAQPIGQTDAITATAATLPSARMVNLPANTEILLSMNSDLTTKGGRIEEGEKFDLTVVHDVKLGDFVVIPKGARGVGEVTWKTGKGAFGKSGKMEVELRYIEIGSQRINVTGQYRQEGEGNTVATVGGVLLAGVFAGFITGKSARIPRGRELKAFTADPTPVQLPLGASLTAAPLQAVQNSPAADESATPPIAAPSSAAASEAPPL